MPTITRQELVDGVAARRISMSDIDKLKAAGYIADNDYSYITGGDAKNAPNVEGLASSKVRTPTLEAMGLTSSDVKAGRGVVTPDMLQEQEPKEVNGGFWGGFGRSVNPINWVAAPVGEALRTEGLVTPSSDRAKWFADQTPTLENLPNRLLSSVVPHPIDTARESYRRGEANESRSDMYGEVAGAAATLGAAKVAPRVMEPLEFDPQNPNWFARQAIRGRNAQIGATTKDLAEGSGGQPGEAVARDAPYSTGGFGRAQKLAKGNEQAMSAKEAFMSTDVRAQAPKFNVDALIDNAIQQTAGKASTTPELAQRITDFGSRMRQASSEITNGERRPLTAAEVDKLRDQISANWRSASKQQVVVGDDALKYNDAAVDMDQSLRRAIENDPAIGKQYKVLNRAVQNSIQAKTIQGRTNMESMAPEQKPSADIPHNISVPGAVARVPVVRSTIRALTPNAAAPDFGPLNVPRNVLLDLMARKGGLRQPLPEPQLAGATANEYLMKLMSGE